MELQKITDSIFRIKVPFENIYTSVFVLKNEKGSVIVDGGASLEDAEKYVLPIFQQYEIHPDLIIRSHCHGDHSGGVSRIASEYNIKIGLCEDDFSTNGEFFRINGGDVFLGKFKVITMPGHTDECIGIFDESERILLAFDSLQIRGLSEYGISITSANDYIKTVHYAQKLNASRIIFSHDFPPYGSEAVGDEAISEMLSDCLKYGIKRAGFSKYENAID